MFEPHRLHQHSLHQAYSGLVPVLKRGLFPHTTDLEASSQALAAARERAMSGMSRKWLSTLVSLQSTKAKPRPLKVGLP
jgi:hypothetical protein